MTRKLTEPMLPHAAPCYPALTWGAEKPKEAGWWWLESNVGGGAIRRVAEDNVVGDLWVLLDGKPQWVNVNDERIAGWRWAGPLPEPQEPSPVESPDNDEALRRGEETP